MNEEKIPAQGKNVNLAAIAIMIASVAYWFTRYKSMSIMVNIAGELDGLSYYTWATMMFMLTAAITAPLWGKIGDLFGKKKVLVILLSFMIVGDIFSAAAPNIYVFIVGYAICGIGGGGMQGTYFALLAELFEPERRGKIGGTILMLLSITSIVLPITAAQITERWSWRYVFVLTIVVYAIAIAMVIILVPKNKPSTTKPKIDYIGTILLAIAVVPFLLALSWGGSKYEWSNPIIIGMLAGAIVFFVLTYLYERKHPDIAIISVRLLKNRSFVFACLVSLFMTASMSAISTFGALFVQGVQGQSATVWSAYQLPANIIGIATGGLAGYLMDKTKRYKWLLVMAPTSGLIACAIFGILPPTAPAAAIIALIIFQKVCGASYMPSVNPLAALAQIEPQDFGAGTGTLNFISNMGNSIAPALLGSVLNGAYAKNIATATSGIGGSLTSAQVKMVSSAKILVNAGSMKTLKTSFGDNEALFNQTVAAVRGALSKSVSTVFFVASVCIVFSVISAIMVKEIPLDQIKYKKK